MKRQILKALTVLLIISALTGGMAACGKKEKAQMSDGTFTVGFDAEFPPYGYKDESGEYLILYSSAHSCLNTGTADISCFVYSSFG